MRKALLLFNLQAGGGRKDRCPEMGAVLGLLRSAGVEASLTVTASHEDAAEQARRAAAAGCDTVIACGGDGTIHDVLQGLAGSQAALGVLPLGTANALAHDLNLPGAAVKAAEALLDAQPKRIGLGHVTLHNLNGGQISRYFTVAAGIGVDAHLFYKLNAAAKQRLGIAAYYARAWDLFWGPMPYFQVKVGKPGDDNETVKATEMLAVRIRNFGGILSELAPGASLERSCMRVVVCRTSDRMAYLSYLTRGILGVERKVPGIDLIDSETVRCAYAAKASNESGDRGARVYVEADGELLGTLPVEIRMVPDASTILVPTRGLA